MQWNAQHSLQQGREEIVLYEAFTSDTSDFGSFGSVRDRAER
jgi:hypothetical protein